MCKSFVSVREIIAHVDGMIVAVTSLRKAFVERVKVIRRRFQKEVTTEREESSLGDEERNVPRREVRMKPERVKYLLSRNRNLVW